MLWHESKAKVDDLHLRVNFNSFLVPTLYDITCYYMQLCVRSVLNPLYPTPLSPHDYTRRLQQQPGKAERVAQGYSQEKQAE